MRRTTAWLVILLAAAGAGYWHLVLRHPGVDAAAQPAAGAKRAAPRAVAVEIATARRETVERKLTAIGTLESNESVVLRPEIAGRVAAIHFREGEHVKVGDLVLELDASAARAELAEAEAKLSLAKRNAARARELYSRHVGSARDRDEAVSAREIAQASVNLYRVRLDKTRIVAPFSGVLGLRRVSVGAYVNPGDDLVTLDDIDPIKVDFHLPEPALPLVHTGQAVTVKVDAVPGRGFAGELYAIAPRVDVAGRTLSLRARLPNSDGELRPGLFARVEVVVERHENAVVVPEQAIVPLAGGQAVFRVVDGKAVLTHVKLGQRQAARVEILSGLGVGETVVTAGQIKLRDGVPVTVVPSRAPRG